MKNKTIKYARDTHDGRMPKGRPKISTQLEKTNLTLDRVVKRAAMKLAASRRQSLSSLVTELLEKQVKVGRNGPTRDGVTKDGITRDGVARDGIVRDGVARTRTARRKLGKNGAKVDGKI